MASIREYHRPAGINEAIALLSREDTVSLALGGGTVVNATSHDAPVDVVDLQALGLDAISVADDTVRMGATARLQDVVDADGVPALVREAARREAPNTLRNAATIGGAAAHADFESGLVAALLIFDASVEMVEADGPFTSSLDEVVAGGVAPGALITAVVIARHGEASWAGTGRTPADTPIVAAYGRVHNGAVRLALTGVAPTPVLVEPGGVSALEPPSDFRGSTAYRRTLAEVLSSRVLTALGVTA